jgi:hypothetical protein
MNAAVSGKISDYLIESEIETNDVSKVYYPPLTPPPQISLAVWLVR